jgi:hypothetical protein
MFAAGIRAPVRSVAGLLLLLGHAVCLAQAQAVNIVGPQAEPVIVLQSDAPTSNRAAAAQDLQAYLAKITSREAPILWEGKGLWQKTDKGWTVAKPPDAPPAAVELHVGWTARALKEVDKAAVDKLDVDGFLIKVAPGAVFLVGRKDWSTAYAVYGFLEDFCGVRWFMPGEFSEDVPRQATLTAAAGEKTYEPAYQHREYSGFEYRNRADCGAWAMRQRVRPRLQYHHNLYAVFDVKKYGEAAAELYPVKAGQRRVPGPGNTGGWQPCLSNPKAVDVALDYARTYFAKNADASSISLGINDGGGYCECPECMKLVDDNLPKGERRAAWFFQFANKVAEGFDREFPDKVIGYLLYGECHLTPSVKVHRRLIGFEVFSSFRLILPENREAFDKRLAELSRTCPTFGLYDWFYGDGLCVPRLQVRQAKYWLQHGHEMGARHVKAEAYMNWGLDGFKYWIHSKLMWDPMLDVDRLMDEFFARYFRESAKPMRDYFQVVERYSVTPVVAEGEKPVLLNYDFMSPRHLETFPPKAVEECEPLLDQAHKAAQSDLVRGRVRYFRTGFNVAKMMTLQYHLARDAAQLLAKADTLPQGMSLLARALARDLDVEQFYAFALYDDPFCVRFPELTSENSKFSSLVVARQAAAKTLNEQVVDRLREGLAASSPVRAEAVSAASGALFDALCAQNRDTAQVRVLRMEVMPQVGKVMVCSKAPAPVLDGKLDDACWASAAVYSASAACPTASPPTSAPRSASRTTGNGSTSPRGASRTPRSCWPGRRSAMTRSGARTAWSSCSIA